MERRRHRCGAGGASESRLNPAGIRQRKGRRKPAFAFMQQGHVESHLSGARGSGSLARSSTSSNRIMHRTLKIAFASALLAAALPATVNAQSSSGNITGDAAVGDTINITGTDTGFKRELKIEKDGKYQVRRVPTGGYTVIRIHKDGTIDPAQSIIVRPGGTARVMDPGKTEAKDVFSGS